MDGGVERGQTVTEVSSTYARKGGRVRYLRAYDYRNIKYCGDPLLRGWVALVLQCE